ncbi:phospholipid scramblase-related protein [Flavobacterium sp. MDT1-60]|uniref:phospholipid scramblase-related protein n=1 Tax=Flavobacterium sp. MDT1-60 TaxID=1979344 RepID=UPI001785B26D|nr:phospholipid scramblase-related protein [Flavobacterium sp. MDT1-60]QOG00565.1 scramblase [Flavobacterium sp. MDT1-60]
MNTDFFNANSYFVDQKRLFFKFYRHHQIYNEKRECIGLIKQRLTLRQKILRSFVSKTLLPFVFEIRSCNGALLASISRGWIFLKSKIIIHDAQGEKIGSIKRNFAFFKPVFSILNASDEIIAEISGDSKKWNFIISDPFHKQIGSIDKNWIEAMKGLFKSADKYNVNFEADYVDKKKKITILSSAIIIDMVMKK